MRELPEHVDAVELRAFRSLSLDEKLEEIFLNGRETNGKVADLQSDMNTVRPTVFRHDLWFKFAAILIGIIVFFAPFVFWMLSTFVR